MKSIVKRSLIGLGFFASVFAHAQSDFTVTERGANYRVLQKTPVENGTNCVYKYTELATGLNYTNSSGQWIESKEQISILPNGGAAATNGQHQVFFPPDIYENIIKVVMPDGRHLKSRPLGLYYGNGSNTALIADVLITVSGLDDAAALYIVHWDNVNNVFVKTKISSPNVRTFEHSTFAPIDIPPVSP